MSVAAMAVMAAMDNTLGVGDVGDGKSGWRSESTQSTSCWQSTESFPAWDIVGPDGVAPVGAEDGCKNICKGFPPPTLGAKF